MPILYWIGGVILIIIILFIIFRRNGNNDDYENWSEMATNRLKRLGECCKKLFKWRKTK